MLPDAGFLVAVVFLFAGRGAFVPDPGGCFDVAVVPVAGLADVGVVEVFAGLIGSTFAFVAVVGGLMAGGLG